MRHTSVKFMLIVACGIIWTGCRSAPDTASSPEDSGVSIDNGGDGVQPDVGSIELRHTAGATVEQAVLKSPTLATVATIDCTLSRATDGGDAGIYNCQSRHFTLSLSYNKTIQVLPNGKLKSFDGATYDVQCQVAHEGDVPNSTLDFTCSSTNVVTKAPVGAIEIHSNPGGVDELATIRGVDSTVLAVIPCAVARATDGGDAGVYSCSGSSFTLSLSYNKTAGIAPNGTLAGGNNNYGVSCTVAKEGDVANSTLEYTCGVSKS